ncbi:MAG: DUF2061 domain-containing protein [Rhodobacteraceae bacterium]|nr:DUF2061 domain-containing protein [Paracoccaceae bacterium]
MDTAKRTILKAILWNLLGLLTMLSVGYVATGSVALGGSMAVVNTLLGLTFYMIYERCWDRVRWGRNV